MSKETKIGLGVVIGFMLVFTIWPLCVTLYYKKQLNELHREHSRIYHSNDPDGYEKMMEIGRRRDTIEMKKAKLIPFY